MLTVPRKGVMADNRSGKWVVGLSGASGMRYAIRLLTLLDKHPDINELHVIVSEAGHRVLQEEEEIKVSFSALSTAALINKESDKVRFYSPRDIAAPAASGSFRNDGMLIIPCSVSTIAAIAGGVNQNLIHRAADVCIKEMRKLILVPRETPLSAIHLENMLKLSKLGVQIVPAMPGFYHSPKTIDDLIDMQCMKVMDCMGLQNSLVKRWSGKSD